MLLLGHFNHLSKDCWRNSLLLFEQSGKVGLIRKPNFGRDRTDGNRTLTE
jgi:hypothetical protein